MAMNLDGFDEADKQPFTAYSSRVARPFFGAVRAAASVLGVQVDGLERLPNGRALLVANHAFGFDIVFASSAIWHATERPVWTLGEHVWWQVPYLRRVAAGVGVVDGTPENADRLLSDEQLVLVLPGGLREAVKPRQLRYQLLWGDRYGFVRAAIRNRAPLVPLASVGADDLFDFMGDAYARGARWLHRRDIPIPLPSRLLPIPHLVPLRFIIGEPIDPQLAPEQANDMQCVRRLRREVEGALHELIENELSRRLGIAL